MGRQPPAALNQPSTISAINLSQILSRLSQKLSAASEPESAPVPNELARAKLAANLEYARQLLHKLEAESGDIKNPAVRQRTYTELGEQKQAIRRLNENLRLLAQQRAAESDSSDDEEVEEVVVEEEDQDWGEEEKKEGKAVGDDADYAVLAKQKAAAAAAAGGAYKTIVPPDTTTTITAPTATPEPVAAATGVRNRLPHKPVLDAQKAELFGATASGVDAGSKDRDARLKAEREQQDALTDDMVSMAVQLKEAAMRFGQSLEDEKVHLDAAKEGLDRNAIGMESTGQKMENLRKNETVGFLWTGIYLGLVFLLTFLILTVMIAMPKIRWW